MKKSIASCRGLCCSIAGAIYVFSAVRFLRVSLDDLWIIMRYAENVANGHGFVFNIGERVEGFTCFGWIALLAGFVRLGLSSYWTAKISGLLFGGITLWLVYRIAREFWRGRPHERLLALLPVSLLAVNRGFSYWSVSGMETALFTLLVVATLYFVVLEARLAREEQSVLRWRSVLAQAVLCLAANLVRPEGMALLAFVAGSKLLLPDRWQACTRQMLVFLFVCVLPLGMFFVWRYHYFGAWLPNTFDAKMGGELGFRLRAGRLYLFGAMAENAFGWLGRSGQTAYPGLLLFYVLPTLGVMLVREKRAYLVLLGWLWLDTIATIWKGGDWMPHWRFLQVAMVCWSLLLSYGLLEAGRRFVQWWHDRRWLLHGWQVACSTILGALVLHAFWYNFRTPVPRPFDNPGASAVVLGQYMLKQRPVAVLAASDIGLLGYKTGYRVIDMVGLVDRFIAQSPGNSFQKEYDPAYVLDQKPDFIMFQGNICLPEQRLEADPRFQEQYRMVMRHGAYRLFERKAEE
jgi:arabinofuranosyltransferase